MCRLSWNLGTSTSWNPQGLSRPVMGLLYLLPPEYTSETLLYEAACLLLKSGFRVSFSWLYEPGTQCMWNAIVQGVPLATEPGISLIILTPMKILQRNLNRSMFVVWEMKRNVSVVRLIVATRNSGPPASQPVSCLTRLSADLSVIWLRVPTQCGCCLWVLV